MMKVKDKKTNPDGAKRMGETCCLEKQDQWV